MTRSRNGTARKKRLTASEIDSETDTPENIDGAFELTDVNGAIGYRGEEVPEHTLDLSLGGRAFMTDFGIDLTAVGTSRRPLCKPCLDWSARRSHLAGSLGTALLEQFYGRGWAEREAGSSAGEDSSGSRSRTPP